MSMLQPSAKLYRGRVADQIVEDLRGQILSGVLPDGAMLPSERELAARYDELAKISADNPDQLPASELLSSAFLQGQRNQYQEIVKERLSLVFSSNVRDSASKLST